MRRRPGSGSGTPGVVAPLSKSGATARRRPGAVGGLKKLGIMGPFGRQGEPRGSGCSRTFANTREHPRTPANAASACARRASRPERALAADRPGAFACVRMPVMRASILWMFVGPLASIVASIGCHSGAPLPEVGDPCARDLDCGGLACDPRSRRCTIAPPREYVATLPGLVLWLEAGSEVTTDGDGLVTTWGDRSRAGNDAVAMARPGAPRRIVDLATGKAAVQFSGSGGTSLQIADSETMRWGHDDYALLAVVRYRNRSGLTANTYGALFVKQCDCNLYVGTAFFLNDPWPAFLEGKPTRTAALATARGAEAVRQPAAATRKGAAAAVPSRWCHGRCCQPRWLRRDEQAHSSLTRSGRVAVHV